jgi:hypothetical protein
MRSAFQRHLCRSICYSVESHQFCFRNSRVSPPRRRGHTHTRRQRADIIVMGAYGRSRLLEIALDGGSEQDVCNGGAPRTGDTAVNCESVKHVP